MTAAGTVAEYNPFHSGHAYMLKKTRENGADAVAAVISSSFVQRGEPAIMSVCSRVEAALKNGVDLVIELPLAWSLCGAQGFARGGVSLLDSLGIVDVLSFGSECGDIDLLCSTAQVINSPSAASAMKDRLAQGASFAAARESAVATLYPQGAEILRNPNDILGLEYISALNMLGSAVKPVCIKRTGAEHDGAAVGEFASASEIRRRLLSGEEVSRFMPESAFEVLKNDISSSLAPAEPSRLEAAIMYKLRTVSAGELALAPDVSEGIENRIAAAAREACSLAQIYDLTKTKRYSHARIRRIVMSAFLGVRAEDSEGLPPYIRVLGFNETGRGLLREAAKKADLPIIMKYSDVKALDGRAVRAFELECRAADVFALCFKPPLACGLCQRANPVILKE